MAKTKQEKEEIVSVLKNDFSSSKSAVFVDYKGLKVKEIEELRKTLREKQVKFSITKNTLARMVISKQGIEVDTEVFKKPVAIAFGMEDEVAAAKEIDSFARKYEAIEILGGIFEKKMVSSEVIKRLALLPSKDELYAKVVGSIASPLHGLVNVMAGNLRGLVNVLNAIKDQKA